MAIRTVSIRSKLIGAFTVLTLFVLALGAIGLKGTGALNDLLVQVNTKGMPSIRTAGELNSWTSRYTINVFRLLLNNDDAAKARIEEEGQRLLRKVEEEAKTYSTLIKSQEELAAFESFSREWTSFIAELQPVFALARKNEDDRARDLLESKAVPHQIAAFKAVEALIEMNRKGAAEAHEQAVLTYAQTRTIALAAAGAGLLLSIGLATFIIRGVSRGIGSVVRPMAALANGDLSVEIPHQGAKTEIGMIADAVQVFKTILARMKAMEDETAFARQGAEAQRKTAMRDMADGFERAVSGIIGSVTSASTELQSTARTMTATATKTATQSTTVAAAAEEAASNVNTVAAAAEELGSSVLEIGRQVNGSAALAGTAVDEAADTAKLVGELSHAASKIGDVVRMISDIAGQTNLLALNATIEAARAGEAGRGFAVVAAEVKELASQTAKATDEIGSQIARIQSSTDQAVKAITGITGRIREISDVTTSIAAAVEEQGAATQEIVRNVSQAATGTGEVTSNIASVAQAAEDTGAAANQVLSSASELSRQSDHLTGEVARFLATVRAA